VAEGVLSTVGRWALAVVTALVGVALIAQLIATLVPQITGEIVGGKTSMEQLVTACRLAGVVEAELCQRADRVFAAIEDGRCEAAHAQAKRVLGVGDDEASLSIKIREVVRDRLDERCPAAP
jgi:hypothetical protein